MLPFPPAAASAEAAETLMLAGVGAGRTMPAFSSASWEEREGLDFLPERAALPARCLLAACSLWAGMRPGGRVSARSWRGLVRRWGRGEERSTSFLGQPPPSLVALPGARGPDVSAPDVHG